MSTKPLIILRNPNLHNNLFSQKGHRPYRRQTHEEIKMKNQIRKEKMNEDNVQF